MFQQQRIALGGGHRDLDIGNARHQRHRFGRKARGAEVTGHAIFEVLGFTDVEQLAGIIEHLIHAGSGGQLREIGFCVEISHAGNAYSVAPITRGSSSSDTS